MQEGQRPGSPEEALTPQKNSTLQPGEQGLSPRELDEQSTFWDDFIARASAVPAGEDPAFWPIRILNELNYLIVNKENIKNRARFELVENLAPLKEPIGKVRSAYAILAFSHVRHEPYREEIQRQLESARAMGENDAVELSDTELEIVQRLCETPRFARAGDLELLERRIPFNPEKRVYKYAEVLEIPPSP